MWKEFKEVRVMDKVLMDEQNMTDWERWCRREQREINEEDETGTEEMHMKV